jgi:hypothetical protein
VVKYIPPSFDAARVTEGLHRAMGFGEPTRAADKATFFFRGNQTYIPGTVVDADDVPFDPEIRPTRTNVASVLVPCAVEFHERGAMTETFGVVMPTRISITLLDEDYQRVRGFHFVVAGGDKYIYEKTEPPVALGSIDVWTVWAQSEDES